MTRHTVTPLASHRSGQPSSPAEEPTRADRSNPNVQAVQCLTRAKFRPMHLSTGLDGSTPPSVELALASSPHRQCREATETLFQDAK